MLLIGILFSHSASARCIQDATDKDIPFELNVCAFEKYQLVEKEMNISYQKLVVRLNKFGENPDFAILNKKRLHALKNAQKIWLKYRDAECARRTLEYIDSSIEHAHLNDCLTALTKERTYHLQTQ